jgi:hypothetical protein
MLGEPYKTTVESVIARTKTALEAIDEGTFVKDRPVRNLVDAIHAALDWSTKVEQGLTDEDFSLTNWQ